jgi:hypothetical protein
MTRHRRQEKPDRVLVGLKIATVVAAAALVGLIIMWARGGGESGEATPRSTAPKPVITQPGDDAPTTTTPPRMEPPALRTETSTIALKPPPPSSTSKPRPTTRPPQESGPGFAFAVIGKPCPEPGVWSVTSNYEPVVCASNPPGRQPRWTPVF